MRRRDRAHDRQPEPGSRPRPRSCPIPAREALERPVGEVGRYPVALVRHLDGQPAALGAGRERHLALPVAQRVVHQVAHGLAQSQLVRVDLLSGVGVDRDRPAALRGAVAEAPPHAVEHLRGAQPLGLGRQLAAAGARQHQQVLGELCQVVALLDRRDQRLLHVRVVPAAAQRALQLGLDHRQRRAQLVARVRHELPLAVERAAQPAEHLVERLAEPADLVVGLRQGEGLVGAGQRHLLGPAPHRLDRPQPRRRQHVAQQRSEQDRHRPADRKRGDEVGERLVAVLQRLADDRDARALPAGQHARRALDARQPPLDEDALAGRGAPQLGRRQRPPRTAEAVDHLPSGAQQLREPLLGVAARARRSRPRGEHRCRARAQPRVDALVEVRLEP